MKKIFLMFLFLFFLTGCNVIYNVDYKNNIFSESISISGNDSDDTEFLPFKKSIDNFYKSGVYTNYLDNDSGEDTANSPKYKMELLNDGYNINFNYIFNSEEEYKNSAFSNYLFSNNYVNDNKINAYNINNIFSSNSNLESITVKFSTDKKISDSNADKVEDNNYYWYINNSNYKNKRIIINFSQDVNDANYVEKNVANKYLSNNYLNYIIIFIVIITIIIVIFIIIKVKNSNKIW